MKHCWVRLSVVPEFCFFEFSARVFLSFLPRLPLIVFWLRAVPHNKDKLHNSFRFKNNTYIIILYDKQIICHKFTCTAPPPSNYKWNISMWNI